MLCPFSRGFGDEKPLVLIFTLVLFNLLVLTLMIW